MSRRGLLLAVSVVAAMFLTEAPEQQAEPQPKPMPELVIMAAVETEPEEATEEEPSPVREDIPLDGKTQELLYEACSETGIPYELALAVIEQETNFRNITGDGGESFGYMQVQPRWHGERMERLGVTDLTDPYSNFLVGCDYLAELIGKGRGTAWALMAYNGGPNYANKMAKAGKESQYAKDVLNYMNNLEEFKYGNLEF